MSDAVWLAIGGILGALARALFTPHQKNASLETAQDCLVGGAMGFLWNLSFQIPVVGLDWPLLPLPVHASEAQRAVLMGLIAMVTVAGIKRVLMKYATSYMLKLSGNGTAETPPTK